MERRRNLRLPLRVWGQLILRDDSLQEIETIDLSLRGASVGRGFSDAVNQPCMLHLFVGEASVSSVTLEGRIVHDEGVGIGIEFGSIDARDFKALLAFLLEREENSDAIQREAATGETPLLMDWNLHVSGPPQGAQGPPANPSNPAAGNAEGQKDPDPPSTDTDSRGSHPT